MNPVTYSLNIDEKNSDGYYRAISDFTDEVLLKSEESVAPIINGYLDYIKKYKLETPREKEEYILELLSFGILWRTYASTALSVQSAPFITLSKMGEWRKKHQRIKPFIDLSRGILISVFLLPAVKNKNEVPFPSIELIDRACLWFEATGEFREEALRFIRWRGYWGTLHLSEQIKIFSAIAGFRGWFEARAAEALGKYTSNVKSFLSRSRVRYRWREDRISCSRTEAEYHLNMVGAELMNRAFREEFNSTRDTSLLLPGCMRTRSKEECEALKEDKGLKCSGCEPKCRVNHLRLLGLKKDFEVYVIPHASDLSLWSPEDGAAKKGVVASACVTTLVEGGWELKRYGIAAQCVLLDYCGCKKHWHPTGALTELNKTELERIIGRQRN